MVVEQQKRPELPERATSSEPLSRRFRPTRMSWALGTVLAVVAAAPSWVSHPTTGFDPSWQAALHMAALQRLQFGTGINFNYGPLGFLAVPSLYFSSTGILAALLGLGTSIVVCVLLLHSSCRLLGLPWALVCTYLAASSLRYVENAELLPLIFLVAVLSFMGSGDHARSWWVPALAGAAGAVLLLAKFNLGVVELGVALVTMWVVANRWRGVGIVLASFAAALLAAWVGTGNRLSHLPRWMVGSKEIASGYSTALGIEAGRTNDFRLLIPVVVILAVGLWHASAGWSTSRRLAAAAAVSFFGFAQFKHGFVRHDEHALAFFGMMPALYLGLGTPKKQAVAGVSALVLLLLIANQFSAGDLLDPRPPARASWSLAADVISPGRRHTDMRAARKAQRDQYAVDPAALAALQGRTVHVDPWETSVMWAYPELRWQPLPVFQSLSAYTVALDEQNADALVGPDAPERILREMPGALDGRNPDFESPAANMAMLCNYRQLTTGDRWQVLGRGPQRCGAAVPAGSARASAGEWVNVPAPASTAPELVFARLRGVDASLLTRAAPLVYKAPETYMETDDGSRFRLVPETAGGPLLMAAPAELGLDPSFGFSRQIHRFQLTQRQTLGLHGLDSVEVDFFRVPLV